MSRLPKQRSTRVLLAVVVLLVLLAGQRAWSWRDQVGDRDRQESAVAAAAAEVTRLITISATDSEKAFDELLSGATAGFREDLRAQATQLRKALAAKKVDATGSVVSAGIARATDDRATVVVAATGTVSNSGTAGPEKRDYRISVDLQRVGDRWLVSGLEFVA